MKTWMDLYDYYLPDVPGCPYATGAQALRIAAQEFCERTSAWRVTMDPVLTVAGISIYEFDISSNFEVVKVMSAKLDGHPIDSLLHDQVGTPARGIAVLNGREFALQPAPAAGQRLEIVAVLKPSNTSVGIEDFLYAAHARAIAKGAKAELFGMAKQGFTDLTAADRARAEFEEAIGRAKTQAAQAYSNAPLRTKPSFL